jgi:serine protease Do
VQAQPLDPTVAPRLGLDGKTGVVVSRVLPGTPAARCGLQDGDVLTAVGNQPVQNPRQLQHLVAALPIGKDVELTVYRDGARKTLTLAVEKQPDAITAEAAPTVLGKIGVKVSDPTPAQMKELGFTDKSEGVLVEDVDSGSIASGAGLRRGMLITKVDQHSVKTVAEAKDALEKASLESGILLQVRTPQGGTTYVLLKTR